MPFVHRTTKPNHAAKGEKNRRRGFLENVARIIQRMKYPNARLKTIFLGLDDWAGGELSSDLDKWCKWLGPGFVLLLTLTRWRAAFPKVVLPPVARDACRTKTPLKWDALRRAGQEPQFADPQPTQVISHTGVVFSHAVGPMAVVGERKATTQLQNQLDETIMSDRHKKRQGNLGGGYALQRHPLQETRSANPSSRRPR